MKKWVSSLNDIKLTSASKKVICIYESQLYEISNMNTVYPNTISTIIKILGKKLKN